MPLENKTAVVTGGAQGFGEGIARTMAAQGARVLIADLRDATDLAAEIDGHATRTDVSDDSSVAALARTARDLFGAPPDILVNNAGIAHKPRSYHQLGEADFDRIHAVNCKSVFLTARHIVSAMEARGSGAVLNIASTAGLSPRPGLNWYNATKGWMITATKTLAVELAPRGIRVNALCPVAGETPLLPTFMGEDTDEIRAKFLATIPLGRFSTPRDMGEAAAFLCSDAAGMITGVALEVDGGRCI